MQLAHREDHLIAARASRLRVALVVVLVVLAASACRVHTEIGVSVKEDGSGTVKVRVGLDDDALRRAPNFVQSLRIDDLRNTGWTVTGPVKDTDGFTYVEATKPFADPQEAAQVFAQISGPNGPFRNFQITRTRSFARTKIGFTGTVDFTGGLNSFGDSDLAQQLDGNPVGQDLKALEQQLNDTLDNVFQIRIAVQLPGSVTSNAPGQATNGAVWSPRLSQTGAVQLTASSTSTRWVTILGAIAAVVGALVVVALLVARAVVVLRRRRRRGNGTPTPTPEPL